MGSLVFLNWALISVLWFGEVIPSPARSLDLLREVELELAKRPRFSPKAASTSRSSFSGEAICLVQRSSLLRSQGGGRLSDNLLPVLGISGASVVNLECSDAGLGDRLRMEVLGELPGVPMEDADLRVVGVDNGSDSGKS